MSALPLVLASQSGSRKAMLSAAGIAFEAVPAHLDERAIEDRLAAAAPGEIATALAVAKAKAVSETMPGRLVLGSDSLVVVEGKRFDKPASREDAAAHLRFFSGKALHLHSAAALVRDGRVEWQGDAMASMQILDLSESFIEEYLSHEWPHGVRLCRRLPYRGQGVQLFETIEGDQFTVLGMPLLKVLGALRDLGELAS
ncbi:MAG: Maf family protein [Sphingomonadaceae bacterium]